VVLCLPVTQDTLVERTGKKAVADDAKARIIDNPTKSILAVGTVPDRVFGDSEGAGRGRGGELVLLDFCSTKYIQLPNLRNAKCGICGTNC